MPLSLSLSKMPPATNGQLATLRSELRVCSDQNDFNPASKALFGGGEEKLEQDVSESV
jgi:hypothetical protein